MTGEQMDKYYDEIVTYVKDNVVCSALELQPFLEQKKAYKCVYRMSACKSDIDILFRRNMMQKKHNELMAALAVLTEIIDSNNER